MVVILFSSAECLEVMEFINIQYFLQNRQIVPPNINIGFISASLTHSLLELKSTS